MTINLEINRLINDPAFSPRLATDNRHVHELARALRISGDLDPIKVWEEPETKRLVILDGRHRVAAYRLCQMDSIPARVVEGNRKAARIEAARDNSKTSFPWTTSECTQYAWGLVIEGAGSKAQITAATRVTRETIRKMRRRLDEITASGKTPTGNWWSDRNDKQLQGAPEEDTDAAKQARIEKIRDLLNAVETRFKNEFAKRATMEELGLALRWHLGQARFKAMYSGGHLADEDEFSANFEHHPIAPPPSDPNDDF
ncbi:ParB-like nuclease domain-containing protein [Pseudorhodobacter antarcticus]|uniref:ParB-like nuclease domain-containing protein n=1 Tax=Pseudorhodobacter antarcticus TaxID=1077947 RepID=A0A1H8NEZ1_9RHOB|nr:ParB/RepB/Spo0J family partition protein [Pseudorhodobacter antarcticus]SEO28146.1 ParB-like nuclease domain-containing protein [Pseudorhodobacter antarcticus]